MKIEDRLSDAMHDYADAIEPSEDSWATTSARFDDAPAPVRAKPARGRLVFAGVAITLVVVLIAVLAVRDDGPTSKVATIPSGSTASVAPVALPAGVLASTIDRTLLSLDSESGQLHETLTTIPRVTSIGAIPPGGLTAVYGTGAGTGGCAEPRAEVGTVDLASGARTRVVSGALSPVVSPDGRFVAYGIRCDGRATSVTLGYTDLRNGENYRIDPFPRSAQARRMASLEPLAWAPDSKRLLYRVTFEGEARPKLFLGRLWPLGEDAGPVELTGRAIDAAAFVDDQMAAIAEDAGTGSTVTITLLYLPCSAPCTLQLSTTEPPAFNVPGRVVSLVASPGGHLLVVTEDHVLYRWSMGDTTPTKLADGVTSASWIPWS